MSDNNVEVKFGAQTGPFKDGVNQAATALQDSINRMSSTFGDMAGKIQGHTTAITGATNAMATGMTTSFERAGMAINAAMAPLIAITAILSGGAFFKSAVDSTKEFTGESIKLSRSLGISVDEASQMVVALGDIYTSTDTYLGAAQSMTRQMKTNEQSIRDMGVQTRDASGQLRPMNDIMMDSIKVLNDYKEGSDRALAAQKLFGRGAADAMQLLKMNQGVLDEAKKKQQALGLTVSQENVDAFKKYKAAMNDVGDVMLAIKKVIGDAIMPILTALGEWFASTGPQRVEIFRTAMKVLGTALNVIATGFMQLMTVVSTTAMTIYNAGAAVYDFFKALKDGKGFTEARAAATARFEQIKKDWVQAGQDILDQGNKMQQRIDALWNPKNTPVEKPKAAKLTMAEEPDKGKDKSMMGFYDAALADMKVLYQQENDLREMSKQMELQYWQDIQANVKLSLEDQVSVWRKTSQLKLEIMKDERAKQLSEEQLKVDAWKYNLDERLAAEERVQAKIVELYGIDSRQYEASQQRISQINRQIADQKKQLATDALNNDQNARLQEVAFAEQAANLDRQLGRRTNAEMIALAQQFEEQRNEIKRQALVDRLNLLLADPDYSPLERERILTQIQELERAHQLKMSEIRNQARLEQNKWNKEFWSSFESGMTSVLQQFAKGNMSIKNLFKSMLTSVLDTFTNTLAKMAMEQMMNSALMKSLKTQEATTAVTANAATAASGAAASQASIPYVGPMLAAAAFAGTLALVMGAMKLFSASKGFDVPAGTSPLTQLHEKEMVLPASQADVIRNMAANGGGGQQPMTVNISAVDARSVRDLFMREGTALADSIQRQARSFKMTSNTMKVAR